MQNVHQDDQGHFITRAFGERIVAHNMDQLKRLAWQAELRFKQRETLKRQAKRRAV